MTTTPVTADELAEALAMPCNPTDYLAARDNGWSHTQLIALADRYGPMPAGPR